MAVKCVERQIPSAGDVYLRLLREAVMHEGKNIAKEEVLRQLAEKLSLLVPPFDLLQFGDDLKSNVGLEDFRNDLQEIQRQGISRFPSLIIKNAGNQAVLFSGHQSYGPLLTALQQVAALEKTNPLTST